MYLLGSFSRSKSTTPLHTKPPIGNAMTVLCPQISNHHTDHARYTPKSHASHVRQHHTRITRPTRPPSTATISAESAESIFLHALASASLCRKHQRSHSTHASPNLPSSSRSHSTKTISTLPSSCLHRSDKAPKPSPRPSRFSTKHGLHQPPPAQAIMQAIPPEELRGLVDLYESEMDTPRPEAIRYPPAPQRTALLVPVEDIPPETERELPEDTSEHQELLHQITRFLRDPLTPHDTLYEAYTSLPHPRISYLKDPRIRDLMRHFSVVEYRSEQSMLRYLSLVDDLTAANIPLTTEEWNSAISFAGRWAGHVTDVHIETSTQIWLRMEQEAGVKSNNVTFNVLFDVAAKAGKFALAEVVMKEMITRGLPENRFFRTNKIYYYGIKRDGAAVRQAYKELVDAGEFIDTAVLNCVIASLIRAGEASAAEHIFERMKQMHTEKTDSQPMSGGWRKQRQLGRVLDKAARKLRNDPERRSAVQEVIPITPNLHTYRLLIRYHAHESGNIDRVTDLLDEMHTLNIQMHGSIFAQLFKGFQLHGGVRYSSWTKARLEKLWAVFLEFVRLTEERLQNRTGVLDEEDKGCYYDVGVVVPVLQAFYKLAGKETTMEIWHDILEQWNPDDEALDKVNGALANTFARGGD